MKVKLQSLHQSSGKVLRESSENRPKPSASAHEGKIGVLQRQSVHGKSPRESQYYFAARKEGKAATNRKVDNQTVYEGALSKRENQTLGSFRGAFEGFAATQRLPASTRHAGQRANAYESYITLEAAEITQRNMTEFQDSFEKISRIENKHYPRYEYSKPPAHEAHRASSVELLHSITALARGGEPALGGRFGELSSQLVVEGHANRLACEASSFRYFHVKVKGRSAPCNVRLQIPKSISYLLYMSRLTQYPHSLNCDAQIRALQFSLDEVANLPTFHQTHAFYFSIQLNDECVVQIDVDFQHHARAHRAAQRAERLAR